MYSLCTALNIQHMWNFMTITHHFILNNFLFPVKAAVSTDYWLLKKVAGGLIIFGFWFQCGMGD